MDKLLTKYDNLYLLLGRSLLGLYFVVPGALKVLQYADTMSLMISKGVPFSYLLLPLTIMLQIGLGLMLIFGKNVRMSSLILFSLTLLINAFIHDFWNMSGDPGQAHEVQNFVKNLAIAAGLLVLAASKPKVKKHAHAD